MFNAMYKYMSNLSFRTVKNQIGLNYSKVQILSLQLQENVKDELIYVLKAVSLFL